MNVLFFSRSPYEMSGIDEATDRRQLIITRAVATLVGVVTVAFAALVPSLDGVLHVGSLTEFPSAAAGILNLSQGVDSKQKQFISQCR